MKSRQLTAMIAAITLASAAAAAPSLAPKAAARLAAGKEVRVVAFGDSITGIYYHSGSRRAWPEMLQLALRQLYPKAKTTVFNAGSSGHTTDRGLQRIQKDVLDRKPHVVVVKFGMNDLAYGKADAATDAKRKARYAANLANIVNQCRGVGAELILCTANSVYPESAPGRPPARLAEFAQIVRDQAKALNVPVVDIHDRWEQIRRDDLTRWRFLMSETIHPSMAGHKCIAQWAATAISGQEISLVDAPPPPLTAARFVARLRAGKPVKAIVAAPLVESFRKIVVERYPKADLTVTPWPIEGKNLAAIETWARGNRKRTPDLVVISLPPIGLLVKDEEAYVRRAAWVVNYSLPFGPHSWTALGVATSSWDPGITAEQRQGEATFAKIVAAHDLEWLAEGAPETLLRKWLAAQIAALPPR